MTPWIGFDLDGTLAEYGEWEGPTSIGKPIQKMVDLAKSYEKRGYTIKILTARVSSNNPSREQAYEAIVKWCYEVFGKPLEITAEKDYNMVTLFDDRCIMVKPNTGSPMKKAFAFTFPNGETVQFYSYHRLKEEEQKVIQALIKAPKERDEAYTFIHKFGWEYPKGTKNT